MIERWIHNRIHALPLALLVLLVLDFAGSPVFAEDTAGKSSPESQIDFERDVQPILTRYGCNSGACHGKQRGQNGFQLSLLGFDSDFDHDSLIMESRGRRVTFARPGDSLLLTKASGKVPHGGGVRLPVDSAGYQLLLEWIKAGAPRALPNIPDLVNVTVEPVTHEFQHHEKQQLQVIAQYTDGSTRNVTGLATYQSNESPIADVNAAGEVTAGNLTGKATIMARYADQFALFTANIPQMDRQPAEYYDSLPRN
ncbi:MAG: Ig-like domain-containing protein, partial [Planctomycetaceae bacterium]|nr:Ig-like domain-containing protein [Planctomycetaceae bacterium]